MGCPNGPPPPSQPAVSVSISIDSVSAIFFHPKAVDLPDHRMIPIATGQSIAGLQSQPLPETPNAPES
jgi:hypothetical protein